MSRYDYLIGLVAEDQPRTIMEIGTWNGARALEMLKAAPGAEYYGFDLFEEATPETDEREKNVKRHHAMADVYSKIAGQGFIRLYKGDTRKTILDALPDLPPMDLIWIDGGHSVGTIASDWAAIQTLIQDHTVVLLDDYYTGAIDTTRFGCNTLVNGLSHEVIPIKDPVSGGGHVQIVRVYP